MKTFVIVLVAILVISLMVCGIVILIFGNDFLKGDMDLHIDNWSDFAFDIGDYEKYNINESISADGTDYKDIHLKSVVSDIEVIKWESDEIRVTLIGEVSTRGGQPYLKKTESNSDLIYEVKYPNQGKNIGNFSSNMKMYLYVPEDYSEDFTFYTVSGDITLNNFKDLDDVTLASVSGDLETNELAGDELEATNVSGSFNFDNVYFNSSSLSSTSGEIDYIGNPGKTTANTVSGDVDLTIYGALKDLNIDSVSGSADINLDKDISASVRLSSLSGNYHTNIPISLSSSKKGNISFTIGNNPDATIDMSSISGNLSVNIN